MFGCHWKLKRGPAPWFQGYAPKQIHKEEFVFDISESHTCKDTHFSQTEQARTTCALKELTRFLEKRLTHSKHSTSCVCNSKDAKKKKKCIWHLSRVFSKHWEKGVLKWPPSMVRNQRQNLKVIPPWSNFFSNQLSFRLSACAYRLCFGTCFSTPGKLTPAVYKLGYCFPRLLFFFFFLHLYLQSGRGLWPLHPLQIFVSLGFAGFSSYRKSIPEVASSHMVLIATPPLPFFPADFAGSEAARTSQPGPGQRASGCEGMRMRLKVCIEGSAEKGKSNKSVHTLYHLVSFRC